MDRTITFGKYKGQPIKKLILQHIGYIMWCLTNLTWFHLTDEEQAVYDALAIANIKYGVKMVFPDEDMLVHVKDKDKLERQETPFIVRGDGMIRFNFAESDNPVIKSVACYMKASKPSKETCFADLQGVAHSFEKMFNANEDCFDDVCYNDIF